MKIKATLLLLPILIAHTITVLPAIGSELQLWSGTDHWVRAARNYKGDVIEVDLDSIKGGQFRYFWDRLWFATKEDRQSLSIDGYARYISVDCQDKLARLRATETLVSMEIGKTTNHGDNGMLVQSVPGSSLGDEVDFVCAQ